MPTVASQVFIARRYLARGFLDTAMHLLLRHPEAASRADWDRLVEGLLERQRIADVVRVCAIGGIPLPRARLLALGDARLEARDVKGAKLLYELAEADAARWERFIDVLTASPALERLAIEVAERHLLPRALQEPGLGT